MTGAFAFWAPKAIKQIFHLPAADILFGGITVLTGITGTLAGGMALDWLGSGLPTAFQVRPLDLALVRPLSRGGGSWESQREQDLPL